MYWGVSGWATVCPPLQITPGSNQYLTISWPSDGNFTLETTPNLHPCVWNSVPTTSTNASTTLTKLKNTNSCAFFRLEGPTAYVPLFSFAIFYNDQLEFTWAATMVVNGPVHANGPIYIGDSASSSLTFNSPVTTSVTIAKKALGGYVVTNMVGPITYVGDPPYVTNTSPLYISIGINTLHALIEIPPGIEDPLSDIGQRRFFDQAGMILLVSNTTVSATLKASPTDNYPSNLVTDTSTANISRYFPFLSITNTFFDQRENKTVYATQIDMRNLKSWVLTNTWFLTKKPSSPILYVADRRTVTATQMRAVRLFNTSQLPAFPGSLNPGFTLATLNPLYIWGNYNCANVADLGTTNTASSIPSALICDALTILSTNWSDAKSSGTLANRNTPSATTVNSAMVAGVVYTTGTDATTWSGGVPNFPRLLEPWPTATTLTINGSLVNLYPSQIATNQFQLVGNYYNAPTRHFNFDQRFSNPANQPPGTPMVGLYPQ